MRIRSLHHASFTVTDLLKAQRFAEDFGLLTVSRDEQRLFMRTAGGDAWCYSAVQGDKADFTGFGFIVESREDLDEAVLKHGATPVRELDTPGGGLGVTLTMPEGMNVDLDFGVQENDKQKAAPALRLNAPGAYSRFVDPQTSRDLGPATLHRLGHLGLYAKDLGQAMAWLESVLGMKCSDGMHNGDPAQPIVAFYRLDRGQEWVDHHTLFIGQMGRSDLHHVSFEVQDFEAQFRTHRWLQTRGWEPNWGVGRHPLGSHVFDVWFSPDRYRFETYSDTDLVNCDHVASWHDVHTQDMDCWSSDSPERYFA